MNKNPNEILSEPIPKKLITEPILALRILRLFKDWYSPSLKIPKTNNQSIHPASAQKLQQLEPLSLNNFYGWKQSLILFKKDLFSFPHIFSEHFSGSFFIVFFLTSFSSFSDSVFFFSNQILCAVAIQIIEKRAHLLKRFPHFGTYDKK